MKETLPVSVIRLVNWKVLNSEKQFKINVWKWLNNDVQQNFVSIRIYSTVSHSTHFSSCSLFIKSSFFRMKIGNLIIFSLSKETWPARNHHLAANLTKMPVWILQRLQSFLTRSGLCMIFIIQIYRYRYIFDFYYNKNCLCDFYFAFSGIQYV